MTLVVLIVVAALAVVVAARRWMTRPSALRRDQVEAFTRARAVTNTWSADPQSTPAPLQEYLARVRQDEPAEKQG